MRKVLLIITWCCLLPNYLWGQSQNKNVVDNLVKEYKPNSYWLTLRYDQYLKSGSFFFIENNSRFQKGAENLANFFPFNSIYRTYFMIGYEHKATDKWYLGVSEKYVLNARRNNSFENVFLTRANISHRGNFLKMKFIKEIAFEHVIFPKSENPNILIQNEGRVSFAPGLVKQFEVFGRPLFALVNYRAYVFFDFNNDGFSGYSYRKFDKTELRAELDYRISDKLLVSLFAIRDTEYSYRTSTFNSQQNLIVGEARTNRITPTFGASINLVFNAPEDFIPGFPIK